MTEQAKKYLADILAAILLIEDFTKEAPNFSSYLADLKTQSAVERQLAIIGEATKKFETVTGQSLPDSRKIIGFRNRLIHAYDSLDQAMVWVIINRYLPALKSDIQKLAGPSD